jgi:hypothetical protein
MVQGGQERRVYQCGWVHTAGRDRGAWGHDSIWQVVYPECKCVFVFVRSLSPCVLTTFSSCAWVDLFAFRLYRYLLSDSPTSLPDLYTIYRSLSLTVQHSTLPAISLRMVTLISQQQTYRQNGSREWDFLPPRLRR